LRSKGQRSRTLGTKTWRSSEIWKYLRQKWIDLRQAKISENASFLWYLYLGWPRTWLCTYLHACIDLVYFG